MASILVSRKDALQANSDRHLTASWKESMVAAKCFSNTFAGGPMDGERKRGIMIDKKGERARLKSDLIYVTSEQNKSLRFKLWHLLQKVCVCVFWTY